MKEAKGLEFFHEFRRPWRLVVAHNEAVASPYCVVDADGVPVIGSGDGDQVLGLPSVEQMKLFVEFVNNA